MKAALSALFGKVIAHLGAPGTGAVVEVPVFSSHGDYTTNIALVAAKTLKKAPMDIALQVQSVILNAKTASSHQIPHPNDSKANQKLSLSQEDMSVLQAIDRVEIVPPGFLNIFIREAKLISQLDRVLKEESTYGKGLFGLTQGKQGTLRSDSGQARSKAADRR